MSNMEKTRYDLCLIQYFKVKMSSLAVGIALDSIRGQNRRCLSLNSVCLHAEP